MNDILLGLDTSSEDIPASSVAGIEKFFSAIGQGIGTALIYIKSDLTIIACNHAVAELYELPKSLLQNGEKLDSALNHMIRRGDFGPNTRFADLQRWLHNLTLRGENASDSRVHARIDGKLILTQRVYTGDGNIIIIGTDVTDFKRRDTLLENVMTISGSGYWHYDFATQTFNFSKSIRSRFTDAEQERIHQDGLWAIIHPEDRPRVKKEWLRVLSDRSVYDVTYRAVLENYGVMYLRNIGKFQYSQHGRPLHFSSMVFELTGEKLREKELENQSAEFSKALSQSSHSLAKLTHEIRTPLNGILGMAEAIYHLDEAEPIRKQIDVIRKSGEQLMAMMDHHLAVAKQQHKNLDIAAEPVSPHYLIQTAATLWEKKAEERDTVLSLHLHDDVPNTLMLDPLRYQQCLNNLLSNAVKFTDGGQIRVATRIVQGKNRPFLATIVQDTGIGMDERELSQIFKPFAQANRQIETSFGGTGLGLSIIKELVEAMDGKITAKSEKGKGSTFAFMLPMKRREDQRRAIARPTPDRRSEHGDHHTDITAEMNHVTEQETPVKPDGISDLNILVAEDNFTNQLVVQSLLEPRVKHLHFVENGKEAIAFLEDNQVDIVIMDIHMPVMDGIEATLDIRRSDKPFRDIPIIALTADPDFQQKRICRNIGMDGALAKPVSLEALIEGLTEVLFSKPSPHNTVDRLAS